MKFNRQQSNIFLLLTAIIMLILMSIFNNSHTVITSDILIDRPWEKEIKITNSDYIKHYIYSITGFYKELPWAVRTAYTIIQISSLALIVLLYLLFWDVHKRKAIQKKYAKLKAIYFEKLKQICTTETIYTDQQIKSILELKEESDFTYQQKLLLIDLFLEARMQIPITSYSISNLQSCIHVFNLQNFMEERMASGKDAEKLKIIQAIRLLHMEIADSYVTRIINHRNKNLQKAARLYYVISNDEDPFRYMEENNDNHFLEWDMLETHQIFEDCKNINKKLPSFIPAINQVNNTSLVSFFIKETAYWGTDQEMEYLNKYLTSENDTLRKSALESINLRIYQGAETKLKDIYYEQPEDIKRTILHTLSVIAPEHSISFFQEAFENTSSQLTKRMALKCLWKAGEAGQKTFRLIKDQCSMKDHLLFLHVESPIIDREVLSLHNINQPAR